MKKIKDIIQEFDAVVSGARIALVHGPKYVHEDGSIIWTIHLRKTVKSLNEFSANNKKYIQRYLKSEDPHIALAAEITLFGKWPHNATLDKIAEKHGYKRMK